MKAKAALFPVVIVISLLFCLLGLPGHSYAGTPFGTVCFEDSFGDTWFLDFGSFNSGVNFDVHGFRIGTEACNGTFVQPISGTATLDGNTVVFGVWSIATGQTCISVAWQGVVDLSTFQGEGSFMTLQQVEDSFSLTEISCNGILQAARNKSQNLKDPSRRPAH